ncbi:polysaccharide biosynthesis tyrosine autokinase [Pseudomonas sp. EpS/L25]|uniref:polysaccharide biosynthesis tyrosine autokinase n=1 Tax=Pseudomonas sp. EpS/L25 TaxID=1749078 RepID=UPI000744299C|nr:polysaccharide biosynthesis tyrosine autokinase [Pseudomonas sp. EpS/L25]KUM43761.1 tyrosine protein kinase [Pseudomonas sp. EpS/L25]
MDMSHQALPAAPAAADIGFARYCAALWRHRGSLLAWVGICTLAGLAYAQFAAPHYQAVATVQIEYQRGIVRLDEADNGRPLPPPEAITEMQLLTSRRVVGEVVDALGLDLSVTPRRLPLLGDWLARRHEAGSADIATARFGLGHYGWGGERLRIASLTVPDALYGQPLTLRAEAPDRFVLSDAQGTQLLEGRLGQPASAGALHLDIAQLRAYPGTEFILVKQRREVAVQALQDRLSVSERGKRSGILSIQLQDSDPGRAQRILQGIVEAYVRQDVARNADESTQQLAFLRHELPQVSQRLTEGRQALDAYQRRQGSIAIGEEARSLLRQAVDLDAQLSALEVERLGLALRFTPTHPLYQTLLARRQVLNQQRQVLQRRLGKLPETQQELLRRQREVEAADKLYALMSKRIQELSVVRAGTVSDVRIIDDAYVQTAPVYPKKPLLILSALLFGCLAGGAWVYLRASLERGIEDADALERLGLPLLATLPLATRRELGGWQAASDSSYQEALRTLRTSLAFTRTEARNDLLLITSASPAAGKSTVALQLARVLADGGTRVLLVDADLRRGRLHRRLQLPRRPGLTDVLAGLATAEEAIQPTGLPELDCLVGGTRPPNPAELLLSPRCTELLRELQHHYDLIILDTPPVLAVTDAVLLAAQAGTSLLVTRHGCNTAKEIEATLRQFAHSGLVLQGAVLNAVPPEPFARGTRGVLTG